MTREEIIKGLKSVKEELHKILTNPYAWVYQPIDEAIEALEQESCEDCISRSELLKALDTWDKFGYRCAKFEKLDSVTEKYFVPYIHYDDVKKAIKGMSNIQPKPNIGHWITTRTLMHDGEYYCDKCDHSSPDNKKWEYCPNCGAKMESEDKGTIEILDKIKVDIRKKMRFNSFNEGIVSYDDISKIIDKYRSESEDKE